MLSGLVGESELIGWEKRSIMQPLEGEQACQQPLGCQALRWGWESTEFPADYICSSEAGDLDAALCCKAIHPRGLEEADTEHP